jgi:hypothetical protein
VAPVMAKLAPYAKLAFVALDGGSSGRPNSCAADQTRGTSYQAPEKPNLARKLKKKLEQQQQRCRTQVVDDEAAVGTPAGGPAEVGLAVGQARGGEDGRGAVLDEVAGVGQRVAEVEQRAVLPLRRRLLPFRGRKSRRRHHDCSENRDAPSPHRRRAPSVLGSPTK